MVIVSSVHNALVFNSNLIVTVNLITGSFTNSFLLFNIIRLKIMGMGINTFGGLSQITAPVSTCHCIPF